MLSSGCRIDNTIEDRGRYFSFSTVVYTSCNRRGDAEPWQPAVASHLLFTVLILRKAGEQLPVLHIG